MAYEIVKSDGTLIATVEDGSVDLDSTSINLIGKNFAGYGVLQNENFVHLLENFASEQAPRSPVVGQIWYDKNKRSMKFRFDQNTWKDIGSVISKDTAPVNPVIGDQWWNTTKQQFYIFNGSDWVQIGPLYSAAEGLTGSLPDVIRDVDGINYVVIKFYINGVVTGIWNKADFQFVVANTDKVPGFYTNNDAQILKPGLTLADLGQYSIENYTNIDKNLIWGTVEDSLKLNNVSSTNYLRIDAASPEQSINKQVVFNSNTVHNANIHAQVDSLANIGSVDKRFNVIHANLFVGNVEGQILGVANQVRNLNNHDTDDLKEGQNNLYFTANRRDEVRNWNNITNKPVLVTDVRVDANSAIIVDKTDNTSTPLGSITGYTGSAGVGYTGSAGVGYTGSAGSVVDYANLTRTSVGSFAFLVSPWNTGGGVVSSNTIITNYTYAAASVTNNAQHFVDTNVFNTMKNLLIGPPSNLIYARKTYWANPIVKGPTTAPGSWRVINPTVGLTDLELLPEGYIVQQPVDTGFYNIVFAVRIA